MAGFYRIHISRDAHRELVQRLEAIARQEETRGWHMDLWKRVRGDARFLFVPHTVPEQLRKDTADSKDYLPFLANFVARERQIPLMADDRVCQAFALNEVSDVSCAAFGTDAFVLTLLSAGKLEPIQAAAAIRQLMLWRYRFLAPSGEMLKTFADQYPGSLPGQALQDVAEYVQDCMRDPGLFGGPEKTELGDSMAMRLYIVWVSTIVEFLILVWADEGYTPEEATQLTEWSAREFLPSCPRVLNGSAKAKFAATTGRLVLSRALITAGAEFGDPRMADAMKAIKNALRLDDEDYMRIVTEILNDTARTNHSQEEVRDAFRHMLVRMRNYALHQFNSIGSRTVVMLQDADLFDDSTEKVGAEVDFEVIQDASHPRRVDLLPGPLVLYSTDDEKKGLVVELLPMLLLSESLEVRRAVLESFEEMIADGLLEVTPKTLDILKRSRGGVVSDVPCEWRPAAVNASDALSDDVLVSLAGVRQSLACEPVIQDSLNLFVPRVTLPSVSSLDSIALEVGNPETDHGSLRAIVQSVVAEASTLGDACARYYARLGYLPSPELFDGRGCGPLDGRTSCRRGVDGGMGMGSNSTRAYPPVPRVLVSSCTQNSCRKGDVRTLERNPRRGTRLGKEGAERINIAPWALRHDLARHFVYHLEAHLPDNPGGANIACFAWWFAERVATLFPDEPKSAEFYRKHWVEPALDRSSHTFLAASSGIGQSFLRYVTSSVHSPWAAGLLGLMGAKLEQLRPAEQTAEVQEQFQSALISHLISSLPFPVEQPAEPTFSLECAMGDTALKWGAVRAEDRRVELEQLVETSRTLSRTEGLCQALRNLTHSSLADQIAVALALKAKAYSGSDIAADIWEVLSDGDWRRRVLGTVEERVLGLLIEAFSVLQADKQEEWFSLFPHYIAELCEETEVDERRRHLFLYTIHVSLASDTVSAVRRLLRGTQKAKFVEMVKEYRDGVEGAWSVYPP